MVAAVRPIARTPKRDPLITTQVASRKLNVPSRTLRRWTAERGIGMLVAGRRLLAQDDLKVLKLLRDGVIG
jgi:DNA-binding transcriptional MerR regulator